MFTLPLHSPPPVHRRYSSRLYKTISFIPRHRPNVFIFRPTSLPMFYGTDAAAVRVHYTVTPTTIIVRFKSNNNLLTTDTPI